MRLLGDLMGHSRKEFLQPSKQGAAEPRSRVKLGLNRLLVRCRRQQSDEHDWIDGKWSAVNELGRRVALALSLALTLTLTLADSRLMR